VNDSKDYLLLVNGQMVPAAANSIETSYSPATGKAVGRLAWGSALDAARAVDAADAARAGWAGTPIDGRIECLRELAAVLRKFREPLAQLETADLGNPIRVTRADVDAAAATVDYFANLASEVKGETIPVDSGGWHFTLREPFGVVVRIVAFNHPILFAAKVAAPLAAGNTVVLKPSPQAPLSTLLLAELAREIFPPGVLNVVSGGQEAGEALITDPRVRRIGFVGSVETGKRLVSASASNLADVSLELGGKNPLVVFPDADLDSSAAAAVKAMNFQWQGQSCGSASRLFVHSSIYPSFVSRLVSRIEDISVGPPDSEASDMGPIVSEAQLQKIKNYIASGISEGAHLLSGGTSPSGPLFEHGFWMRPTVFGGVTQAMRIAREEIFGPVLCVLQWHDESRMMADLNSTGFGLTANFWTQSIDTALRIIPQAQAGYCYVNGKTEHFLGLPFGGYKDSGRGREESLGELLSYSQIKSVSVLHHLDRP
jgi:betaine-aldehyde dehydrogenase